jgi:adenylosuccinate lyase
VAFLALESNEHFFDAASKDSSISKHLTKKELASIFDAKNHLGASSKIIDNVARLVKE